LVERLGEMGLTLGWWSLSRLSMYWLVSVGEKDSTGSDDEETFVEKDTLEDAVGVGSEVSVEERLLFGVWNSWVRVRELRRTIAGMVGG
jgi:hypothetical protein